MLKMETKNMDLENKKMRSRGENWAQEEKDLFLEIMTQSAPIIENKLTDTNTNRRKTLEWEKIQQRLEELTEKRRGLMQLKGFWRRLKLAAKKSVSIHRKAVHATGGGQRPTSPLPEQIKIIELCPTDFVLDENVFDSDSIQQATSLEVPPVNENNIITIKGGNNSDNSTIHDFEEDLEYTEGPMDITTKEYEQQCSKPNQPNFQNKKKKPKNLLTKAALIESNMLMKKKAIELIEKEYNLKMIYQRRELAQQKKTTEVRNRNIRAGKRGVKKKLSKE